MHKLLKFVYYIQGGPKVGLQLLHYRFHLSKHVFGYKLYKIMQMTTKCKMLAVTLILDHPVYCLSPISRNKLDYASHMKHHTSYTYSPRHNVT